MRTPRIALRFMNQASIGSMEPKLDAHSTYIVTQLTGDRTKTSTNLTRKPRMNNIKFEKLEDDPLWLEVVGK